MFHAVRYFVVNMKDVAIDAIFKVSTTLELALRKECQLHVDCEYGRQLSSRGRKREKRSNVRARLNAGIA